MTDARAIHPDFQYYLDFKSAALIETYLDLRLFILEICPDSNELLYHTHALTSVFTLSEKLSDGFVMLPIYTNHVNLGFHKGALLDDSDKLLSGTGKLIRHIPIQVKADYRNEKVERLVRLSIDQAKSDMDKPSQAIMKTISKIKR